MTMAVLPTAAGNGCQNNSCNVTTGQVVIIQQRRGGSNNIQPLDFKKSANGLKISWYYSIGDARGVQLNLDCIRSTEGG